MTARSGTAGNTVRDAVRRELSLPGRARRRSRGLVRLVLSAALGWGIGSGAAEAQAPYRQELLPGFSSFQVNGAASPELADLDADGDLDAVVGDYNGKARFFVNVRAATSPLYVERTGSADPFAAFQLSAHATPELADLDGDGDLDAVAGERSGGLRYFENTRNAVAPAFVERTAAANPFDGIDVGDDSAPKLTDLDGDGDLDALVGAKALNGLFYFRNTGSPSSPVFVASTGTANPLSGLVVGGRIIPDLADMDADGDLDAITGGAFGAVQYFANTGTSSAPAFIALTGSANPFATVDAGYSRDWSDPELVDFDFDGDFDVVLGEIGGTLLYFANTGSPSAAAFVEITNSQAPFAGIDLGFIFCRPELADLDADGDLDTLTGDYYGGLRYFPNTGAATRPAFVELTGSANPFSFFFAHGLYLSPALADVDGDGDLDAIVGEHYGNLNFLENTGSSTQPAFVAVTGSGNPFDGLDFAGTTPNPELGDLDGDGDLDALMGAFAVRYFANTGSPTAPAYVEVTGSGNPFAAITGANQPTLVDFDRDGDLDLVAGEYFGLLRYFANTGTASSPAFVELTGTANPLTGPDVTFFSVPQIADLDLDGDFDALLGENKGRLVYFPSQLANVFADGFESGDLTAWSPPADL